MLSIAVIGAGRIGKIHAANAANVPGGRLAWVADPVPGAAQALAGPLGAKATLDPLEAINDSGTDAVVIGSPTPTHVDLILAAVDAGKPVLCEKPVDLDLERAKWCRTEVEARGGRAMIGFNQRFDPTYDEIHRLLAAGAIGQLEQLVITSRDPAPPPPTYIAESGGLFRDMTIHDLDMALHFCGPFTSVQAVGQNVVDKSIAEAGDIDACVVVLKAASGATATILNSRRSVFGYDKRLEAFGAAGMLQAANQYDTSTRTFTPTVTMAQSRTMNFFLERFRDAYHLEMAAFVQAAAGQRDFAPSLSDGIDALALADAALESLQTGAAIAIGGN